MGVSNRVVVVDSREDIRVSRLRAGEGAQGVGMGGTRGGNEI